MISPELLKSPVLKNVIDSARKNSLLIPLFMVPALLAVVTKSKKIFLVNTFDDRVLITPSTLFIRVPP